MSLKNLMVHLDQGERCQLRLELAVALARKHQARLVGVFGQRAQAQQIGIVASWPSPEYVAATSQTKARFEQASAGLKQAHWHDINRGSDHELLRQITDMARYFDMVIMGQHDDAKDDLVPPDLPEEVIVNAGRPVLMVPYAGSFNADFQRPLIAWNKSREAAHALNDALPLIENCAEATVVSLDTQHEHAESCCSELTSHFACHGIKVKTDVLVVDDIGIMDMLLNRVTDRDADLLVMGAHGQIGFPFVSRGAGTRHILRHMTVPVLLSN